MELRSTTCPACGGRNFTLEEAVEDGELTALDLRCARGCGFYTYEAGDRSAWCGIERQGRGGPASGLPGRPRVPASRAWPSASASGAAQPREEEERRAS